MLGGFKSNEREEEENVGLEPTGHLRDAVWTCDVLTSDTALEHATTSTVKQISGLIVLLHNIWTTRRENIFSYAGLLLL